MAENNAVTKEELKEVVEELRQEFRQGLAETNQNVLVIRHKVDGLEHKVDGLEHKVDGLDHKVDGLDHKVDGLEHKVDGLEHKVDANDQKLEAFRAETLARFDSTDKKHDEVVKMILGLRSDMEANHREYHEIHSRLLTGTDKVMKELENHRVERMSSGAIQDRHGKDLEAIKKHLGFKNNNGKPRENVPPKQSSKRNKRSK